MNPFSFCKHIPVNSGFKRDVHLIGTSPEAHANPYAALGYPKSFLPLHVPAMIRNHLTPPTLLERTLGSLTLFTLHKNIVLRRGKTIYPLRTLHGEKRKNKHVVRYMLKSSLQNSIVQFSMTVFHPKRNLIGISAC